MTTESSTLGYYLGGVRVFPAHVVSLRDTVPSVLSNVHKERDIFEKSSRSHSRQYYYLRSLVVAMDTLGIEIDRARARCNLFRFYKLASSYAYVVMEYMLARTMYKTQPLFDLVYAFALIRLAKYGQGALFKKSHSESKGFLILSKRACEQILAERNVSCHEALFAQAMLACNEEVVDEVRKAMRLHVEGILEDVAHNAFLTPGVVETKVEGGYYTLFCLARMLTCYDLCIKIFIRMSFRDFIASGRPSYC